MKLQISFDFSDLNQALSIASEVAPYADIIEVGTILIYNHGTEAIRQFKQACPDTIILADTKIVDCSKEVIETFAQTGVNWITVMAGSSVDTIHTATTTSHNENIKIMLDLVDANSFGQSALEAKNLGVDALLFHLPYNDKESLTFLDQWDMIRGNTDLPIFVSAEITRDTIHDIIAINPYAIIIGKAITNAENPAAEAQYFAGLIKK